MGLADEIAAQQSTGGRKRFLIEDIIAALPPKDADELREAVNGGASAGAISRALLDRDIAVSAAAIDNFRRSRRTA